MNGARVIKIIFITIGVLLIVNAAAMTFATSFSLSVIFTACVGLVSAVFGVFFGSLSKIKWLIRSIYAAIALLCCLLAFLAIYGSIDNATYAEDAVIVHGGGIMGEQVLLPLAYRLNKAIEYADRNPNAVIVVSGGMGDLESIPEALAMERYLLARGIDADRIVKEDTSTSTYTNLVNSKKILDELFARPYTTALITNDFHIYRAVVFSEKLGLNSTHCHAKTPWQSMAANYLRECAAVTRVWIIGR